MKSGAKLVFAAFHNPRALLWMGILVRVVTGMALAPDNPDVHSEVLRFLVNHKALPHTLDLHEAYAPPLYYLLAAPLLALSGYVKVVQILSLVFSTGTLLILYDLIYRKEIIEDPRAQHFSFLLACFLPEFVTCSLFVSDDTLTFFLAALCVAMAYRFVQSPGWRSLSGLACTLVLGLLTKQTFLAFVPVLAALVYVGSRRYGSAGAWRRVAVFSMISLPLGSYKFVENYAYYGRPFLNNMDAVPAPDWVVNQRRSYRGWRSFTDFDITKPILAPSVSDATNGSYPILLYGSFWYQYSPISNFEWHTPVKRLAQLIYLLTPVPTAVFLIGAVEFARRTPGFVKSLWRTPEIDPKLATRGTAAAFLFANFGMLVISVVKYHGWSIMDSRLLYPSLFGGLVIFSAGVTFVSRWRLPRLILSAGMAALTALFVFYPAIEFVLTVHYRLTTPR